MENNLEKIYHGFLYGIGFIGSLSLFAFTFFFIGIVFLLESFFYYFLVFFVKSYK